MLYMAIGQIIHQERQREIERALEVRRLLDPAGEGGWNRRHGPSKVGSEPHLNQRHEAAGATS